MAECPARRSSTGRLHTRSSSPTTRRPSGSLVSPARPGPFDRAALAAVPDAAIAGEVIGRADGEGRPGARPSSTADADGDQLAAVQRPAAVSALWLLPVLHVRVRREVDVDGHDAAARRGDGPLRDPAGQLRRARRDERRGPRDRRHLLRRKETAATAEGQGSRALRQRRRDAAAVAELRRRRGFQTGSRTPAAPSAST